MTDQTMLLGVVDPSRAVLAVDGADAEPFLQNLLTNDVAKAAPDRAVYAALLTPQGKFLHDMMISRPAPERFLLEVDREGRDALLKRLTLYKLRAKVAVVAQETLQVALLWHAKPADASENAISVPTEGSAAAYGDPRDPALGIRILTERPEQVVEGLSGDLTDHERLRIALSVPKAGLDLIAEDTFPLEAGFERVHGVDFKKGCYVGQEVTARMRHKAVLKKRLVRLRVEGGAPQPGAEIRAGDRPAGKLGSVVGDAALAILRVDRIGAEPLAAEGVILTPDD